MLPRRLEPEVMDTVEEARDYDEMDHAAVNQLFVTDFLAAVAALPFGARLNVIDVGTGTAQIPIELCRRDARAEVVGVDLSGEMLRLGRVNVAKAELTERIRLDLVDAKGLAYADGSFTAVMSNSIVHHIPEPKSALAEMVRVCAPGGLIFVRDLLRPQNMDELHSLHAALSVSEVQALVAQFGFAAATVTQTSDRHWTWVGKTKA
jgi:ubiquinone/menaquinone biosynthesis C-methylase UbiE